MKKTIVLLVLSISILFASGGTNSNESVLDISKITSSIKNDTRSGIDTSERINYIKSDKFKNDVRSALVSKYGESKKWGAKKKTSKDDVIEFLVIVLIIGLLLVVLKAGRALYNKKTKHLTSHTRNIISMVVVVAVAAVFSLGMHDIKKHNEASSQIKKESTSYSSSKIEESETVEIIGGFITAIMTLGTFIIFGKLIGRTRGAIFNNENYSNSLSKDFMSRSNRLKSTTIWA